MSLLPVGHRLRFTKLRHCQAGAQDGLSVAASDLGCDLLFQNLLQARTKKPGVDFNVLV